jgi:hypothetical protein
MCEVRHPRRRDEPSHRQHLQPAHHHVEQRTEDARTLLVDFSEQPPFRRVAEYVFQLEDDGAILEVGARHDVADSLKSNRTRSAEQRFVKILEHVRMHRPPPVANRQKLSDIVSDNFETFSKVCKWVLRAAMNKSRPPSGSALEATS